MHRTSQVWRRLRLERLEDRTLLSGSTFATAVPLAFASFPTLQTSQFLSDPREVDLYQVPLNQGDRVHVAVNAQMTGSGLQSWLRVFGPEHNPIALDEQAGGDPQLTFQAAAAGTFYVAVSSAGNGAYDPSTGAGTSAGATTGRYTLTLQRTAQVPLQADLAGSALRLDTDAAAYGDLLSGTFSIDNRGGAAAGGFAVQVVLAPDNLFGAAALVLTTVAVPNLGAGQAYASGPFHVHLPDLATATAAGLPVSGPVALGLRMDPAGLVPELNRSDQSGVHRDEDWLTLTVVTPVVASGLNHLEGPFSVCD
jgi:hypothetical protein